MAESQSRPDATEDELGERAGKINERLAELEVKVDLWDDEERERFRAVIAELKEDQAALVAAAKRVGASAGSEWKAVAESSHRALDRLESEVQAAWADFEVEMADDVDAYRSATQRQLEAWQGHRDRMRLQAKLAEMEARDAVADLEQAFEAARPELERAKDVADEAFHAVKDKVREAVAHLRAAARDASRKMG